MKLSDINLLFQVLLNQHLLTERQDMRNSADVIFPSPSKSSFCENIQCRRTESCAKRLIRIS